MKLLFALIAIAVYFITQDSGQETDVPSDVVDAAPAEPTPDVEPEPPEPEPEPVAEIVEVQPEATPEPEPEPRLAPEGVFFALEPLSIIHSEGIIGIIPGTELRLVEHRGSVMVMAYGTHALEVSPTQVTNDLDIAMEAARADAAGQQAVIEHLRQRPAPTPVAETAPAQTRPARSSAATQQTTSTSDSQLHQLHQRPRTTVPRHLRPRDNKGNFIDGYDNEGYKIGVESGLRGSVQPSGGL